MKKRVEDYRVGDRVILKEASKRSTIGYADLTGCVLTIKEILPQYNWSCSFEEDTEENRIFRLKDIADCL